MFQKKKRIENRALLDYVKTLPCAACPTRWGQIDPHHVTSVGAGGGDTIDNVMPLCRMCHSDWETMGPTKFYDYYTKVQLWFKVFDRMEVIEKARTRSRK